LRTLVLEDVCSPHPYTEIEALVSPEVAARLDKSDSYGVFWSNRSRTTRRRVSETSQDGWEYRWQYSVRKNPKEQWIAILVANAGLSRETVDAAREMIKDNRQKTNKGHRFFELGGVLCCGGCGTKMLYSASPAKGRLYSYYKCRRVVRDGKDACPAGEFRPNHRAEKLEHRIWELVSDLMKRPEQLRADLERMIELERESRRGDPEREAKAWLEKLAKADQERRGYLRLAAKGRMTDEDLDRELVELEEIRRIAERKLAAIKNRRERIELLERNKDEILNFYAKMAPEALDGLSPEERHRLYRMLRLKVAANPDRSLEVSGALGTEFVQSEFVKPETVSR
jgi:hypothetical protein